MRNLSMKAAKTKQNQASATTTAARLTATQAQKCNIMQLIEHIVTMTKGLKLSPSTAKLASIPAAALGERLALTPNQSIMLSVLVDQSDDENIRTADIARHFACNNTTVMCYNSDLAELTSRGYIKTRKQEGKLSYRVPADVVDSMRNNTPYCPPKRTGLTIEEFIEVIGTIFDEVENDNTPIFEYEPQLEELISKNLHLTLCKFIHTKFNNNDNYKTAILLFFIHRSINKDDNSIFVSELEEVINHSTTYCRIKRSFQNSQHTLLTEGLIENQKESEMSSRDRFCLSSKTETGLLAELEISTVKAVEPKDLIRCATLPEKTLFYNDRQRSQIEQLSALLEEKNFTSIQQRLTEHKMRRGFACLLYGAPGTGKTETVYQIARQTERDIMTVDVSTIKNMWVGESEKNIKSLFVRYATLSKHSTRTPILLFNEADAVLGIRQQGAERAVDKMENSIQNIILQEMENLDGIMMATTNLTKNLDSAFERRFIFKIEFEKPSLEAKCAIWHSMIPSLNEELIEQLARLYDFSGGQIENIARKQTIEAILTGSELTIDQMHNLCRGEQISKTPSRRPIGY